MKIWNHDLQWWEIEETAFLGPHVPLRVVILSQMLPILMLYHFFRNGGPQTGILEVQLKIVFPAGLQLRWCHQKGLVWDLGNLIQGKAIVFPPEVTGKHWASIPTSKHPLGITVVAPADTGGCKSGASLCSPVFNPFQPKMSDEFHFADWAVIL